MSTQGTPSDQHSSAASATVSGDQRSWPGSVSIGFRTPRPSSTKKGWTRCRGSTSVSRTMRRSASVRRSLLGRSVGKLMTTALYGLRSRDGTDPPAGIPFPTEVSDMRHTTGAGRLWLAAAALALGAAWASAEDEGQKEIADDARKYLVESRTERLLGDEPHREVRLDPATQQRDLRKDLIETPTELLVGPAAPEAARSADPAVPANPKVAPGLVRWHADLAAAQAASRVSGKPVLLFQMLGNLDDEFC